MGIGVAPSGERLEHGRGHGKDPGIARRHNYDPATGLGQIERMIRALELDAVVGGVKGQPGAGCDTPEIGNVADDIGRLGERLLHLMGQQPVVPRSEARDDHRSAHSSHSGRRPVPCTITMAK